MKYTFEMLFAILGSIVISAFPVAAGNMGGGHGGASHGGGGHDSRGSYHGEPSNSAHGHGETRGPGMKGEKIHSSSVDGYQLTYELVDMRERMEDMPDMPEMPGTHHLMVYVEGPDGAPAENAKTGFLIQGPDGEKQTVMCVGMGGGYGADVKMDEKGAYSIKTKIVRGNDKVFDSFTHRVD
jgi:hypothetical protein